MQSCVNLFLKNKDPFSYVELACFKIREIISESESIIGEKSGKPYLEMIGSKNDPPTDSKSDVNERPANDESDYTWEGCLQSHQ